MGSIRLKRFDESTITSRRGSQAATPPVPVKGIGGKGTLEGFHSYYIPNILNVESCVRYSRQTRLLGQQNCISHGMWIFLLA